MIYCIDTNKPYIGQTEDLENRKQEHFSHLKIGNHPCVEMQKDYNKYGEDSFRFSILENCEKDKLNHLEDYYILSYNAISNGYNSKRGNIVSMSERNFCGNDMLKSEPWEVVLSELHNDKCSREEMCTREVCLQTYIYEMNQMYKQNKTISDYLEYIINNNSKFYVYEKTLSGGRYIRVHEDNIEIIYDKYAILGKNLVMTNRYNKQKDEDFKYIYKEAIKIINDVIYEDKKCSELLNENIENKICLLEFPVERNKFTNDCFYDSFLYKTLLRYIGSEKDVIKFALRFGLSAIEEQSHITINDILNTNLKFEIDRR